RIIINPDITIEDRPLKHVTPAMEDSFRKHVDSLLKIGAIRPSKSRNRTMAMIVNLGITIDPVTGREVKGKDVEFLNTCMIGFTLGFREGKRWLDEHLEKERKRIILA
ncbi:hypothetical protein Tco_1567178, partial [Tanacetum coccineum]